MNEIGSLAAQAPLLELRQLHVTYGGVIRGLKGLSLRVDRGAIVALLGANGAGKTTALRAISGLLSIHQGKVADGDIVFDGRSVAARSAVESIRDGIAQIMEGRRIFAEFTIEENLQIGAFSRCSRIEIKQSLEHVFELFPLLRERRRSIAGYLSGGQQQMLAIGRALMAKPRLLLLDEPSLGLAPKIIDEIRSLILKINGEGVSILLVEQNATMALSVATHGYVIENGRVALEGLCRDLVSSPLVREHYLGIGQSGRRSFRKLADERLGDRVPS
jgi:branched-chain amino acid transport system ATP-binding protein